MTSKPSISSSPQTLESIRARLDIIDQRLHEALMERMDYMRELAEWKKSQKGEKTGFHPAREAKVLRRRAAAHKGRMPLVTLIHMWREIFSASLRLQQDMPVIVHRQEGNILASAQSWAGAAAEVESDSDIESFFARIKAQPEMIGLIACSTERAWWQNMGEETHIVARWPFLRTDMACPLYVLANMVPETSGDDISLYARDDRIIETEGFILPNDPRAPGGRFLGCYARGLDA